MPARAPGLRANASQAWAVALPWPNAHKPEAIAMENPAAKGTISKLPVAPPCASNGVATERTDSAINTYFMVPKIRMVFLLYELPPVGGWRSSWEMPALTLNDAKAVSSFQVQVPYS